MTYLDEVYQTELKFKTVEEARDLFWTPQFIKGCVKKFGRDLPFLFVFHIDGEECYGTPAPTKQGLPMDWKFFAEIDEITPADIEAEANIEKRRLLIMEYGINNYLTDVKELQHDAYGVLLTAIIDDGPQRFVKVRNGTVEPIESQEYLRERGMLTLDNHKIYYIPVPDEIETAKAGIEWSWNLNEGYLSDKGWDDES